MPSSFVRSISDILLYSIKTGCPFEPEYAKYIRALNGGVLSELTYKKAGVDIDEGDKFVRMIAPVVKKTFRPEVMTGIGSFGSLFKLDTSKYKKPVLVSGTDGVGTKLRIAFMTGVHDTVGIDLVAMCVNDILTSGAEPLFFLDYFATGKLKAEDSVGVVEGIAKGCEMAGAALVGGETAEMPGFYPDGEYDLSGFAVGVVDHDRIIDGSTVEEGDVIIGLPSSGIHSNGYSLVRKVFFEKMKMGVDEKLDEFKCTLGEELLRPTSIYVKQIFELLGHVPVKAMAHITGGGIPGNLPRVLPDGLSARVDTSRWPELPVFSLIRRHGQVPEDDMRRTFNMGIGFTIVVKPDFVNKVLETFRKKSYDCYDIGVIVKGNKEVIYA
jgi:phosphoribosylformylglycinamidine cyclo-ligase